MAKALRGHEAGLVVGSLFGGWHILWALLVASGLAQPLLDFVFQLHMITPVYAVMPFSLMHAVGLVVMTAVVGYVLGHALAWSWNSVQK